MDPVAIETRRADNVRADSLDGGAAAPSYANVITLLDNSGDVRIPESFAKLRFVLEKAHVLQQKVRRQTMQSKGANQVPTVWWRKSVHLSSVLPLLIQDVKTQSK
jgi:hypothetical protein